MPGPADGYCWEDSAYAALSLSPYVSLLEIRRKIFRIEQLAVKDWT